MKMFGGRMGELSTLKGLLSPSHGIIAGVFFFLGALTVFVPTQLSPSGGLLSLQAFLPDAFELSRVYDAGTDTYFAGAAARSTKARELQGLSAGGGVINAPSTGAGRDNGCLPCSCSSTASTEPPQSPWAKLNDAILPLLRDWGCGHKNMEVPRVLVPRLGGRNKEVSPIGHNRIVVDVGLGLKAEETFQAVAEGFIVFSFDPDANNIASLRAKVEAQPGLKAKFHFVELTPGKPPNMSSLPHPPSGGFAYVFLAALGEEVGSAGLSGASNSGQVDGNVSGPVPILSLDAALPPWAADIFFAKIDTQGYELKVLRGARNLIQNNRARYILFEFSPFLMERGNLGNHTELLRLLLDKNYLCFDMYGSHLALPRPSTPVTAWQEALVSWKHAEAGDLTRFFATDPYGPWTDIMCANLDKMLSDQFTYATL